MKEFKLMLIEASKILNVDIQLQYFLENKHLYPEVITARNKIRFAVVGAEIRRGIVCICIEKTNNGSSIYFSLEECLKRIKAGSWLEFKKMPKKKLKF